jgi:hypothetical protein
MLNTVPVTLSDGLNTQDRWYTDAASIDTRQAQSCRHGLQLDRNIAVEVARRAIISENPEQEKTPAATAGVFEL